MQQTISRKLTSEVWWAVAPSDAPSKSIVVFVLAQALKGVLVVFHAQRVEQRATHLLSARRFVRWTDGLSRSDNLFELRRISSAFTNSLLCSKSAIATESTISFVADPGNAPTPLRSPVEAEERGRLPAGSTAAAPTISSIASTACTARFPFQVPLPSLLAISATIWARTFAGDFMHAAIFWDAALMPAKCSMTYINKEADIQISLARLILSWAGSPALRCCRNIFIATVALLAFFLLFVVGLFRMRPRATRGSHRRRRFIFCPACGEIIHCGSRTIR
jgi:hypothetical protein